MVGWWVGGLVGCDRRKVGGLVGWWDGGLVGCDRRKVGGLRGFISKYKANKENANDNAQNAHDD